MNKEHCHCEEPTGRRGACPRAARSADPWAPLEDRLRDEAISTKLLRFARNDLLLLFLVSIFLVAAPSAYAVRPDEMLANPALEARAEQVGRELRCLVCRNQSIEDSEADLAHDLRLLVRRRIAAGDSDAQVIAYIRSRYGDYVLLRPPLEIGTLLLWGGPALLLLLGGIAVVRFYRSRGKAVGATPLDAPLDARERRRLAALLGETAESS
jgi:cytochrome c-type biogenesis protein CcmH